MKISDYLLRFVPREGSPAPHITSKSGDVIAPRIQDEHDDIARHDGHATGQRYIVEPFFLMIEYTDADGFESCRRVTIRNIEERNGTPYLKAFCHEREAMRTFRIDRITNIISQDGEVEPAGPWFAEIMSSAEIEEFDPATNRNGATGTIKPYTALRRSTAPAITVLVAAARSDEVLHRSEVEAIILYCEEEAIELRNAGAIHSIDADMFEKIERTIRRIRPTSEDVMNALAEISEWDEPRQTRFAQALTETVGADGTIDATEIELLEEVRAIGARKNGFGWGR